MTVTLPKTIHVTVFDSATVFDGLTPSEVIYRYDLFAEGIADGWAGAAVVEQIRSLAGQEWPDIEVIIDADENVIDTLTRLLATKAVAAHPAGQPPAETVMDEEEEAEESGRHRLNADGGDTLKVLTIAAIGLAVLVLAAGVFFALRSPSTPEPSPPPEPSISEPVPPRTEELDGVRAELPEGFSLERDGDVVRAVGPDPNLRILIAVDPLYSIGEGALFDEIARLVETDQQLSHFVRTDESVTYIEEPGDGSSVRWTSWVDGANQVSVGCHTRATPTAGQHATCTIVTESVTLTR